MFKFIQDPTVTPKELAFCYKELQAKEEKLLNEKKLFHEQLLSLQHDVQSGDVSETGAGVDIKKLIEEIHSKIKNIIVEHEAIADDMEEIKIRLATLIPEAAKKRLNEIRELESHSFAKKKGKLFREFLSTVAGAVVIKQNIDHREDSNYNFEFRFNKLSDKDKKFFINEIKRIRNDVVGKSEFIKEGSHELNDEKIELEKAIKGEPFMSVNKLLKEVGAKVTKSK